MKNIDLIKLCKDLRILGHGKKLEFPLKYKVFENKIKFWYETKSGRFEPNPIIVKRYIPLNNLTLIAFGLIQAESTKIHEETFFDFSNSSPDLVKFIIDYFSSVWGVPNNKWVCYVTYWKSRLSIKTINKLKNFWSKKLILEPNRISIREGPVYRLSENASEYGVASLRLNNKTFRMIALHFLENAIKSLVENNQVYAGFYLQGLLSGDGSISLDPSESLAYVSIGFNPRKNELHHYLKLLRCLNIKINEKIPKKEGRRFISITGWKNYYKILLATRFEPFYLDDDKNIKFWKGILTNQYVKSLIRLKELNEWEKISSKNYAEYFKIKRRTAQGCIKRLINLGLLEKVQHFYKITSKGFQFLNTINTIEKKCDSYEHSSTHNRCSRPCRSWKNYSFGFD